ncbi:hypothetical protein GQ54DRAFT_89357 [Martensiomyces pterosporus]|nr:hypothetical protein GQ54DRAFT_89357 [Martensiomyces pterosporus]
MLGDEHGGGVPEGTYTAGATGYFGNGQVMTNGVHNSAHEHHSHEHHSHEHHSHEHHGHNHEHHNHEHHGHAHKHHSHQAADDYTRKRSFSHAHHGYYQDASNGQIANGRSHVSWRRLWSVLIKEHSFLGPRFYTSLLHMSIGVLLWAVGIFVDSLALMCYAFIVMFDACSLFTDLLPTILEYSNNHAPSTEYPFGLQILPTLLEFANSLTLLYRGVQALKEGIEHIAVAGHDSHSSSIEFETYSHKAQGHNSHAVVSFLLVLGAISITTYSAARFSNHHYLWEACSKRKQNLTGAMQNAVLNPYNVSSLLAGLWMLIMIVLAPSKEESAIEPISCVLVAGIMAYTSFPTCVYLGKILLHAATGESAESAQRVVWQISRLPGVLSCSRCQVWNTTHERYATALRICVDSECDANAVQRQIAAILSSYRLGDWTIEMRAG